LDTYEDACLIHRIYTALLILAVLMITMMFAGCARKSRNTAMDDYNTRIKKLSTTDPANTPYEQTVEFPVGMDQIRGIAVDKDDNIYVVGDRSIIPYTPTGAARPSILQEYAPYAIAIDDEYNIYVAMQDHVRVYTSQGTNKGVWDSRNLAARFCSISCNGNNVYVGDAGNKEVLHYDIDGRLLGEIGKGTFVVPSRHLDVQALPDGDVWAVNPGKHLVALYQKGRISKSWGKTSAAIDGFSGCCNPTDIVVTKQGSFITSEKGIPRVKLYDAKGNFVCVVAPPDAFQSSVDGLDVAVDSKNRVLVMDPQRKSIRVFERKKNVMK
jgi:DNA-binding beta-propeller fold protein YncE